MKFYVCIFLLYVGCIITANAAFEIEPNDNPATANSITPGENTTGQLSSGIDQDWYGFSMSSPGVVSIVFDSPENSSVFYYHNIQVRNAEGFIVSSFETGKDASIQAGLNSSGTYYVTVRVGGDGLRTGQYALSITTSLPQTGVESEPNGAFGIANTIQLGQKLSGQVASLTDEDWLSFTIGGSGSATLEFDSPENSSVFYYHAIQVRNASGTVFAGVNSGKDTVVQCGLPAAGTYYIVISAGPDGLRTGQYGLTLTTTATPSPTVIQAQIHTAVEIVWNSRLGKSYVVEWSPNMITNSWFPLSPAYTGTAGTMSFMDSIRGRTKAFYRVREN